MGDYLIWSIEHTSWWRPGRWGYTRTLGEAGTFSAAEAAVILEDANLVAVHECAIPVACVGPAATIRNAQDGPTVDGFRRRRTF